MNIIPYKPVPGRLVEVYRNLHNGKLSVRDYKTKRVVGHADEVFLEDVEFRVSQAGRKRVLREKRKNVHAVVRGTERRRKRLQWVTEAIYDPYRYSSFVDTRDERKILGCTYALVRVTGAQVRW